MPRCAAERIAVSRSSTVSVTSCASARPPATPACSLAPGSARSMPATRSIASQRGHGKTIGGGALNDAAGFRRRRWPDDGHELWVVSTGCNWRTLLVSALG